MLTVEDLTKSFGNGVRAVNGVSLIFEAGTFFCLLGPSGCGKTTLLRLIGGYVSPDAGRIWLAKREITHAPPERRDIGMVFQNYALFPHLTARENVAFGLKVRRIVGEEQKRRVEAILDCVGLSMTERTRRPRALSGGQQQRVALARALVIEPRLLLLDEPLANLDRRLREQLRGELKEIQHRAQVTTILVTHDQDEALALADQVGLMFGGRLLQIDTPQNLYARPRTPFIARFVGEANLFTVEAVEDGAVRIQGGLCLRHPVCNTVRPGVTLLLRPEQCRLGRDAVGCPNYWTGQIVRSAFLGADRLLDIAMNSSTILRARVRPGTLGEVTLGERISVSIPHDALWPIPEADSASLPAEAPRSVE